MAEFHRLTERSDNGVDYLACASVGCETCDDKHGDCPAEDAAIERLAAYEDNGLYPEEIARIKRDWVDNHLQRLSLYTPNDGLFAKYVDSGLSPERAAELGKADVEGRLLVLPCKVGDSVYCNDDYFGNACKGHISGLRLVGSNNVLVYDCIILCPICGCRLALLDFEGLGYCYSGDHTADCYVGYPKLFETPELALAAAQRRWVEKPPEGKFWVVEPDCTVEYDKKERLATPMSTNCVGVDVASYLEITKLLCGNEGATLRQLVDAAKLAAQKRYQKSNRVLTLDELYKIAIIDDPPQLIYYEASPNENYPDEWCAWWDMVELDYFNHKHHLALRCSDDVPLLDEKYNIIWRCWLRKPTKDERNAVSWIKEATV